MNWCPDFRSANIYKGPWDQEKFKELLAKWIVATDQPFHTIEKPEFCEMIGHAHHPLPELKIPYQNAVKRYIMKMGEDTIEATKELFAVHESQLCIISSLTSHYRQVSKAILAFHLMHGHQAIIMHSWQLWHILSQDVEN